MISITKGKMMNKLKTAGVRKNAAGIRLHQLSTSEIAVMYFDTFGGFNQ